MEVLASVFAQMAGVSQAAVCTKIKNGTLVRNSGGKIDTDNPINRAYLDKKQAKFKADIAAKEISAMVQPSVLGGARVSDEQTRGVASSMLNMTLRELLQKHSDLNGVEKYAKILRDISAADERDQKVQERRLVQIPKDFVVSRIFGFVDQLTNRLLDVPESVCDQIIALALSNAETQRHDIISFLTDNISRCIAGTKEHIISELNGLKGKYEKQENDFEEIVSAVAERTREE